MAAPTTTRLRDALSDLLAAAAACLTDPPADRYISAGPPAVGNCELLAVYVGPYLTASLPQPGEIPPPPSQPRVAVPTLVVELWRQVCEATTPTVDQLDADGRRHALDAFSLTAGLTYRLSAKPEDAHFPWTSLAVAPRAGNVDLSEVIEPSGGFVGWRASVAVYL